MKSHKDQLASTSNDFECQRFSMLALVLHPQVATRDLSQDLTNLKLHSLYTITKHTSGSLALLSVYLSAQIYGYESIKSGQSSEILIGKFANESQSSSQPLIVGTKFFTVPWTNLLVGGGFRLGRRSMIDALRASLKRMDRDKIDLYQVRNAPQLVQWCTKGQRECVHCQLL